MSVSTPAASRAAGIRHKDHCKTAGRIRLKLRIWAKPTAMTLCIFLLSFVNYLGLPADVISVLVCYCKDRARQRGSIRNPSLRTIEKEAYAWAERGIDTVEEAAAFIQNQNFRNSRLRRLMDLLQIRGRSLTAAEERYAQSWLDMGMEESLISMAYERTCLNTGGLNWPYMNKILQRWQEQGLRTPEDVQSGDRKSVPKGASGQLGEAELRNLQRVLQEG